jgi:hypothetical protein
VRSCLLRQLVASNCGPYSLKAANLELFIRDGDRIIKATFVNNPAVVPLAALQGDEDIVQDGDVGDSLQQPRAQSCLRFLVRGEVTLEEAKGYGKGKRRVPVLVVAECA